MKSFSPMVGITWIVLLQAADACDTFVVMPDASATGTTILGKNSDRPAFDAQPLMFVERATWPRS